MGTKISDFPVAVTPLSGSELVPIVQLGGTVKTTVDNLSAAALVALSPQLADKLSTSGGEITANSSTPALSITQTGTGGCLLVEDSNSPDASPFVVSSNGSVGIGTAAPVTNLEVNSQVLASARFFSSDNQVDLRVSASGGSENLGTITTLSNHGLALKTAGAEKVRIDTNGNVGIGVTSPAAKLDVAGNLAISGSTSAFSIANTTAAPTVIRLNRSTAGVDKKNWELAFLNDGVDQNAFAIRAVDDSVNFIDTALEINKKTTGFGIDNIQFFTNGVQRALFTSTGSVIFGPQTSSDAQCLINGTSNTIVSTRVQNLGTATTSSSRFEADFGSSTFRASFGAQTSLSATFGLIEISSGMNGGLRFNTVSTANPFIFQGNGTEVMRITGTGTIGIGITSPVTKLDISNATSADARFLCGAVDGRAISVNTGFFVGTNSSHDASLMTNGFSRLRIDSSGRVAIGVSGDLSTAAMGLFVNNGSIGVATGIGNYGVNALQFGYASGNALITASTNATAFGSAIQFFTNYNFGVVSEKMRLSPLGDLGIGTTNVTQVGLHIAKPSGNSAGMRAQCGNESAMFYFNDTEGLLINSSTNSTANSIRLLFAGTEAFRFTYGTCFGIGTSVFGTNANRTLAIANTGFPPQSSPTGVGQIYVEAGALKYRGANGTITTIAVS